MIPEKFLEKMRQMPDLDLSAFLEALERPAVRALRVNTLKASNEQLLPLLPFAVTPLPFAPNAHYAPDDKVGALPAHHAGMFYMQDPGAISTVAAAAVAPGLTVIDLCAAPGGKSTQLAAAIGEEGVLVSNEYVPARCRILQGNVERIGAKNVIVTNLSTDKLADFYGARFDLVVADAPCSGEGMFRKYEVAGEEWSPENVANCAIRQREILTNAVALTKPGGRLLYSTCTFSPEENEQNVDWLLSEFPDFKLIPVADEIVKSTADGITFEGCRHDMTLCRRFYPHISPGEGQFVALLQRNADSTPRVPATRDGLAAPDKKTAETVRQFLCGVLTAPPADKRITLLRDSLWLTPDFPIPSGGIFAPGVCVGTLQKGRIEPHHQLYSAYGKRFCRRVDLAPDDPRVLSYLRGEEIALTAAEATENGYAALLYSGAPLGGGKIVGDRLKNHYPKGLRNRS